MPVIVIEGNVGAGKTTFIALMEMFFLSKGYKVKVCSEGVDDTPLGVIFQKFCENPTEYATPLQYCFFGRLFIQLEMCKMCEDKKTFFILDRSIIGGEVFTRINNEDGNINDENLSILLDMYSGIDLSEYVDHVIYLEVSPIICLERIKQRGRTGEDFYTVEILEKIRNTYIELLQERPITRIHWYRGIQESWDSTINVLESLV